MSRRDYTQVIPGKVTCRHGFAFNCETCRRDIFTLNGVKDGRGIRNGGAVTKRTLSAQDAQHYGIEGTAVLYTLFAAAATKRAEDAGKGWTLEPDSTLEVWQYPTTAAETFHAAADAIGCTPEQLADIAIAWALRNRTNGHVKRYVRTQLRKVLAS